MLGAMEGEAPPEPIQVNAQKVKPQISQIPAVSPGCSDICVYLRHLRPKWIRVSDSGRHAGPTISFLVTFVTFCKSNCGVWVCANESINHSSETLLD